MTNCPKEFELDVMNNVCAMWVLKPKILQSSLINAFSTQKCCSFWKTFSP